MKHFSIIFVLVVLAVLASTSSVSFAQSPWTRLGNPVLDPGSPGEWDDIGVIMPSVLFVGSTYHMWYTATDVAGDLKQIGYATSSDGITWTKYNNPATPNPPFAESDPVLNPGSAGSWDDKRVVSPFVLLIDSVYHMWYAGSDDSRLADILQLVILHPQMGSHG
jgi:predicted GH43/DUF377 family glycosyl hydrolase